MKQVNYLEHQALLNDLFFPKERGSAVKRPSKEYDDFWPFLERYQKFMERKGVAVNDREIEKIEERTDKTSLCFPKRYDRRYRVNLSINGDRIEDYLRHRKDDKRFVHSHKDELTDDEVRAFKLILEMYLDFLQKQKFAKILKVKKDKELLPIYQYKARIIQSISEHQVVVIAGDTGCGKSTQVPQYLTEAGWSQIVVTQPRRIACIALAQRVSQETFQEMGTEIGYQVRFEKRRGRSTRILFLTEGLLLRQMLTDPLLERYCVVVLDEVHERHIQTDFLLGLLKCLVRARKDLKVILMSATINIDLFSRYFSDAPVVKVPGRLFSIELQYLPLRTDELTSKSERIDPAPYLRILRRIDSTYSKEERGDLLVFLSGYADMNRVADVIRVYAEKEKRWIVLLLHSALSVREQDRVFHVAPDGVRKCILSTNIAETSVTIDGVRFVADSGKVKEMSWDPQTRMQRLQPFWISRASAEQRKGRAGRTGPGVCFRLYAEADYDALQEYTTPEVRRVPLDSLVLQMISMGLPDVRRFPFIEPPEPSALELSIQTLSEAGALTFDEALTPIGEMLSQLPVDVVLGKMLILASCFHMVDPVLTLAAALSVQSPLTHRAYSDVDAVAARADLESDHGDPFTLLNVMDEWIRIKTTGSQQRGGGGSDSRKWCRRRGLEEQRLYEIVKLRDQFRSLLADHNLLDASMRKEENGGPESVFDRLQQRRDRKRLGYMRRKERFATRRCKVLRFDDSTADDAAVASANKDADVHEEEEDEQGSLAHDIRDLEFRLNQDLDQLQQAANRSRQLTQRDIALLKLILCSGLYPQVSIGDDSNSYLCDQEQAFHTKAKPFVLLHPNDIFAQRPQSLRLDSTDVKREEKKNIIWSSKHQLLAYVSILETTKPYLMSTLRTPALQTLLLYARRLEANHDASRIICDDWLEIRFEDTAQAEQIVSATVLLRGTLDKLMECKLAEIQSKRAQQPGVVDDHGEDNDGDDNKIGTKAGDNIEQRDLPRVRNLERILAEKLTDFVVLDVLYSVRRVLPGELQHIYRQNASEASDLSSNDDVKVDSITDYLRLNALNDEDVAALFASHSAHMHRVFVCEDCGAQLRMSVAERLQHQRQCRQSAMERRLEQDSRDEAAAAQVSQSIASTHGSAGAVLRFFLCPKCNDELRMSTGDIMRHRKTCQGLLTNSNSVQSDIVKI